MVVIVAPCIRCSSWIGRAGMLFYCCHGREVSHHDEFLFFVLLLSSLSWLLLVLSSSSSFTFNIDYRLDDLATTNSTAGRCLLLQPQVTGSTQVANKEKYIKMVHLIVVLILSSINFVFLLGWFSKYKRCHCIVSSLNLWYSSQSTIIMEVHAIAAYFPHLHLQRHARDVLIVAFLELVSNWIRA